MFAKDQFNENCLFLCGNVGNGKTHLAVATLRNIKGSKGKSLFITAEEFFASVNHAAQNAENKINLIKSYLNHDCLLIDGLDKNNYTEAAKENLYVLINYAWANLNKIIITTNLSDQAFKELDERVYSRIRQMSIILPFTWEDYRTKE